MSFPVSIRRLDIELLLCVYWLDKVGHCWCIAVYFHILAYKALHCTLYQLSSVHGAVVCLEQGADYPSITDEHWVLL